MTPRSGRLCYYQFFSRKSLDVHEVVGELPGARERVIHCEETVATFSASTSERCLDGGE